MITVSFLGQDISMSRYVFAYGEYLRLFDSYEKRLLQHFEGAKAKGRKEIENIINEEIDRIVHDILKRAMSEDIYSVTKSDILKNKAYIAYTSFCKGENWRSEHYGLYFKKMEEILRKVVDGMMVGEMRDEMQGRWTHYLTTSNGYGSSALWQWVIDGDEAFMIFHSDDELTDGKEIEWNPLEGTFSIAGTTFVVEKGGNSFVQKNGWNYRKGGYLPKSDDEKQAATYESIYAVLRFSNIRTSNNSLYTICSGTVTNSGKETYKYVQIKGSFKDDRGSVIDTASTYLVGGEGLAPGESTTFKLYVSKNYSISSCDVSIYDYD